MTVFALSSVNIVVNGLITRRDGLGANFSRTEITYLRELQPEYRQSPDLTGNGSYNCALSLN